MQLTQNNVKIVLILNLIYHIMKNVALFERMPTLYKTQFSYENGQSLVNQSD